MRSVAFLGGINVGGHRVKMVHLRTLFEGLGLASVSTFIASGNVIFESDARPAALESLIEPHLADALGYAVPTFVRSVAAVRKVASHVPFDVGASDSHYVAFARGKLSAAQTTSVHGLSNDTDHFAIRGAEFHWRVHGKTLDSTIKVAVLQRAAGQPFTVRNITSVRKLVATLG